MAGTLKVSLNGLRPWQEAVWGQLKRFNVLVIHRRAGKTVLAIARLLAEIGARPGGTGAYIAPQYTQAKRVAWAYLKQYAGMIPGSQFNEAELKCSLPNGGIIYLLGAENPDPIRGIGLDYAVLDEVAQMPGRAWREVIRPALADRQGGAIFIGTPMGMANQFYEFYRDAEGQAGWFRTLLTSSDTQVIPQVELEAMRREMREEEYRQEMECDWSAAVRGAYFGREMAEAERAGRIGNVPWDKALPVHTSWDLGIADTLVVWFWQMAGQEIRAIDLYACQSASLPDVVAELRRKPYVWGRHYLPHDVKVRELGTGQSRLEVLQGLGLQPDVVANVGLMDGIEQTRVLLSRTWFDRAKCHDGIEALKTYRTEWDDLRRVFHVKPLHSWESHYADAARMFAVGSGGRRDLTSWGARPDYRELNRATI